jgi:hypothetical protein
VCAEPILYRLFLRTGGTLVSYGEFARVGDRVVVSMPLAPAAASPRLQLVTLPESAIDWPATDRYSAAARYAHNVRTRAEADYAVMNADVAQQLNDVALAPDAKTRLAIAERARRTLGEWPADHHNYRFDDVRQLVGMLDEIITELRAATDDHRFELALVAAAAPPPHADLFPAPTTSETIGQAIAAARLADVPAEKLSLLQSVLNVLEASAAVGSSDLAWVRDTRKSVSLMLKAEVAAEHEYSKLGRALIESATSRASRADVRGVERLLRAAAEKDATLGGRRPEQMAAVLAVIEDRLAAARRLRLERDQWRSRVGAYRGYWRELRPAMNDLARARKGLDDIRALAGPDVQALGRLDALIARGARRLAQLRPPMELVGAHGILASAAHLAANAARLRRDAVVSGQLKAAWDASSAAAGAMMLLARARADVERTLAPPQLSLDPASR